MYIRISYAHVIVFDCWLKLFEFRFVVLYNFIILFNHFLVCSDTVQSLKYHWGWAQSQYLYKKIQTSSSTTPTYITATSIDFQPKLYTVICKIRTGLAASFCKSFDEGVLNVFQK